MPVEIGTVHVKLSVDAEHKSLKKLRNQIKDVVDEGILGTKQLNQIKEYYIGMENIVNTIASNPDMEHFISQLRIYPDWVQGLFQGLQITFDDGSIAKGLNAIFDKLRDGFRATEYDIESVNSAYDYGAEKLVSRGALINSDKWQRSMNIDPIDELVEQADALNDNLSKVQECSNNVKKNISDAADEASRLGTSLSSYDDDDYNDDDYDESYDRDRSYDSAWGAQKEIERAIKDADETMQWIASSSIDVDEKIERMWQARADLLDVMNQQMDKSFNEDDDEHFESYEQYFKTAENRVREIANLAEWTKKEQIDNARKNVEAIEKEVALQHEILALRQQISDLNREKPQYDGEQEDDESTLEYQKRLIEYDEQRIALIDRLIKKRDEYNSMDHVVDVIDFDEVQQIPKSYSKGTELDKLERSRGGLKTQLAKHEKERDRIIAEIQRKQEEVIQETIDDTKKEIEEQLEEIKQEEPKKKRSRKKKEPEPDPNQIGMFDDTTEHVSEKSAESLTEEKHEVQEVEAAFEQAADAKGEFEEANKEAGKSADHSSEKFEDEAEALDDLAEAAESAADSQEKLDKRIHKSSGDGSFVDTKVTSGQDEDKYGTAYKTVSTTVTTDSDGKKSTTTTETWDYRKYEKELKTERQKIERAQKSMQNYLAQFQSKTLQHGTQFDQFNKLSSLSIESLEDIEKAESLIKELEAAYNSTVASFRKGSASLNPFVNAINGAERLETSIEDIALEIKSFSSLPSNVSSLYNDMLSKKAALDSVDKNSATYIQDYAQAYGDLKVAMNAVVAAMRQSRKENKLAEQMVLQAESVDKARRNLDLYESQLAKNGTLSEENQAKIRELREELELIGKEGTGFDLKLWTNEFNGFKSDVQMIQNYLSIGAKAYAEDLAAARREQEEIYKIRRKLAVMDGDDPEYQVRSEDRASHQTNYDALFNKLSDEDQQKLREQEDKNEREIQLLMRQQEKKEEVDLTAKEDVRLKIDEYKTRLLKSKELTAEARHEIELLEERLRTVGSKTELEQIISDFDQLKLGIRATQNEADAVEKEYQEAEVALEKVYQLRKKLALLDKDDPEYAIASRDEQEATAKYGVLRKGLRSDQQKELNTLEQKRQDEVDASAQRKRNEEDKKLQKELNVLYEKQERIITNIWRLRQQKIGADEDESENIDRKIRAEREELDKVKHDIKSKKYDSVYDTNDHKKHIYQYYREIDAAEQKESDRLQAKRKQRAEQTYGQNQYNSMVRRRDALKGRMSALGMDTDDTKDAWNVYIQRLSEYNQLLTKIQGKSVVSKEDKKRLVELQGNAELAFQDVKRLVDEELKLRKQTQAMGFTPVSYTGDIEDVDQLKEALKTMFNAANKSQISIGEFNQETGELAVYVRQADGEMKEYIVTMGKYSKTMNVSTKQVQTFSQNFKLAMAASTKKLTSFVAARIGIEEFFQQFRQGLGYVKGVDTALTELKKVTDATASTYDEFIKDAGSIGRKIGSTITDFTNATADFARLGNNIADSTDLATAATVYKNVGDGIDDISTATESIISTQAAFKNEIKDGMTIVDKFNAVGNRFSTSSAGIGDALLRSASALAEGNNTLDESIGLVVAANTTVQNTNKVGTALKTLTLRLRGMKTELEDAGLDAEDMAETTSTLQKKLLALTHGKVDIMLNADEIKSTYDILKEFAAVYDEMTDAEQAAAMELMGGKVQANVLASLVKNFEQAEKVIKVSANSAGSALAENEKYLDSIAGKMSQFTNATENFWITLISSETVKKVIEIGTRLMDVLTGVTDKVGVFSAAIPLLVGGLGNFAIQLFSQKTYLKQLIPELGKQAAATKLVGEAAKEGVVQLLAAKVASEGFGTSLKQLGTVIGGFIAGNWKALAVIGGASIVITALSLAIDNAITTHKEYVEELKIAANELDDTSSELNSVGEKLETTKDRLQDLYQLRNQGKLSFVEEQELQALERQNDELERYQYLLKAQQEFLSKKRANALVGAYAKDDTIQKKDPAKASQFIGTYVGEDGNTYGYVDGAFTNLSRPENEVEIKIRQLESAQKSEEKLFNELTNAYREIDSYSESELSKMNSSLQELQTNTSNAEQELITLAETYQGYLTDSEYFYEQDGKALEDWQKESNKAFTAYLDNIDKIYMALGVSGAKESFIDRIFGVQGSKQAQSIKELAINGADEDTIKRYISDDSGLKNYLREFGVSLDFAAECLIYLVDTEKKQVEQEQKVAATIARSTKSISALTAGYEKYNAAVDVQNELLHDGMVTSEEYYNSLLEFVGDETKLGQVIDKNNGYLVTNADLLNDIIEEKKDEQLSNVRLARSQAKIKYAELAKNLTKVLNTSTKYNSASKKTISSLKDQIRAVQNVIENYDRLEDQYLGTYSMFERFEDAATIDAETDTLSKFLDMLNAIREGLGTGQLGTKQFATAVEHLIPDEYLDGLESASEYAQQIAKYLTEDLGSYITLDDGNFEINDDNVIALIQQAIDNGHFVGTVDSFEIADGVQPDDLAESWGTTYDGAVAFLGAIDRYNISSESLLSQMDDTIEGRYGRLTGEMLAVAEVQERLLEGNMTEGLTVEEELEQLAAGGSVNLNLRPQIDTSELENAGWEDAGEGIATVFTQTFTDELGTTAINFTPIIADRSGKYIGVLSPDELTRYAEDVIAGVRTDDLGLQIGMAFKGEDAIAVAEQTAIKIHELHESLMVQEDIDALNDEYASLYDEAIKYASEYYEADAELAKNQQRLTEVETELSSALTDELDQKFVELDNERKELEQEIDSAQNKIDELRAAGYTDSVMPIAVEGLDQQISAGMTELSASMQKLNELIASNEDGQYDRVIARHEQLIEEKQAELAELSTQRDAYQDIYIEKEETILDVMENIEEFTIGDKTFKVAMDGCEDVEKAIDKIIEELERLTDIKVTVNVEQEEESELPKKIYTNKDGTLARTKVGIANAYGTSRDLSGDLVGELGRETVVDPHRGIYYTVGDNGAELVDLPKDAIVFNHKQTEEIFKKGHTNSRGKAFASGNAYPNGISSGNDLFGSGDDSSSDSSDPFEDTVDFVEIKLQELADAIEDLNARIENAVGYETKNQLIDEVIANYRQQLSDVSSAIAVYTEKAAEEFAKIPEQYRDMAKNGAFEVKDFVGDGYEDTVDAINNYREWAQKIDELNLQLETTKTEIAELAASKLDNIIADSEALTASNEAQISAIESVIAIRETYGQEVAADYYERMIPWQEAELQNLRDKKRLIEETIQSQIEAGNISAGSDIFNEAMSQVYAVDQEIADIMNSITETRATISETKFNNAAERFDMQMRSVQIEAEQLQSNISLLETQGEYVSSLSYSKLSELGAQELNMLQEKKQALLEILDLEVASGRLAVDSDPYNEMIDQIYEIDSAIMDAKTSIEEFQNAINDLHWENFDKLLTRLGYIESEIQHVANLMSDEKMVTDDGEWTEEGITALAMQAQAMETARYQAAQYAEAIEELERTRDRYSEEEYITKLNELTEGQWECIEAYESAKDAIVDLNSSRIEAVKNGIQKEIDAYAELIELAKEELNAKKALRDFEKNINSQTTAIAELERQIAARAGSTDAATIAERKKLEAELLKAKESLNDTYYDNAVTSQEQALDEELAAYNKAKDAELEALELTLENVERIVAEAFDVIKINAEVVMGQLNEINDEYGINLSDALTLPWTDGQYAIDNYTGHFLDAGGSFTDELDRIKDKWEELQKQADATAVSMLEAINADIRDTVDHTTTKRLDGKENGFKITEEDSGEGFIFHEEPDEGNYQAPYSESETIHESESQVASLPSVNDLVTVKPDTTDWSRDGGNGTKMHAWVPGSDFYVRKVQGDEVELSKYKGGAPTGWVKLKDLVGYASGTSNVKKDQLAWLDELGEEIVLNAGPDGRIQYLTKGSAVIPHDASEKLMELSQLDPTEVLNRSKPVVGVPGYTDARVAFDISFGSLVHVDTVSEDTLPKLKTLVRDEFDSLMKNVNSGLKKFVR